MTFTMNKTVPPPHPTPSLYITCHFAERYTTLRVPGDVGLSAARSQIAAKLATRSALSPEDVEASAIIISCGTPCYSICNPLNYEFIIEHRKKQECRAAREDQERRDAKHREDWERKAKHRGKQERRDAMYREDQKRWDAKHREKQEYREKIEKQLIFITAKLQKGKEQRDSLGAELQKEKEFRAVAKENYRRLLENEREERIEQDTANEAYTAAAEQFVVHQASLLTFDMFVRG